VDTRKLKSHLKSKSNLQKLYTTPSSFHPRVHMSTFGVFPEKNCINVAGLWLGVCWGFFHLLKIHNLHLIITQNHQKQKKISQVLTGNLHKHQISVMVVKTYLKM